MRELTHQVATAMFYLHSFGIVHRDMKPDNLMMISHEESAPVKIIDFGLSKIIGPSESTVDPFGTIPYAAPEIILRHPYDMSVDMWSFGVTLYFLLSGAHPFEAPSQQELLKRIVKVPPPFEGAAWEKVSPEAIDLIQRLLEKDRASRIKIVQVLEHPFITHQNEKLKAKREHSKNFMEKFKNFSLMEEEEKKLEADA